MNVQPIVFDNWLEIENPIIKTDLIISADFTSFKICPTELSPTELKPYDAIHRITNLNIEDIKEDFRAKVKEVETKLQHYLKLHKAYQDLFPHIKTASNEIRKKVATL